METKVQKRIPRKAHDKSINSCAVDNQMKCKRTIRRVTIAIVWIYGLVIPLSTLRKGYLSSFFVRRDVHLQQLNERNDSLLLKKIKERYDSLPSAPWPQLDHRTSLAIVDGELIGIDDFDSEVFGNNTIVTTYYEFESKHSVREYEIWYERILKASEPMIIFVEPKSRWANFTREHRNHAPTIIASQEFNNITMVDTFSESFWDYEHSIDTEARIHKGSNVYKIWNQKMIYLYATVQLNPFDTDGFIWMDAGYFRKEHMAPKLSKPILHVNLTDLGVPREKMLFLHVRNDDLESEARVNIAGNSYFGTKDALLAFYFQYYLTFWDWVKKKNKFIGSDQFVLTETCRRYPMNCHPYFGGGFRWWFAFADKVFLGKDLTVNKVSPHYLFLDEPPTDLEEVPDGQRVSYCNGTIVTSVSYDFGC